MEGGTKGSHFRGMIDDILEFQKEMKHTPQFEKHVKGLKYLPPYVPEILRNCFSSPYKGPFFFLIAMDANASLCLLRPIPWALKLTVK